MKLNKFVKILSLFLIFSSTLVFAKSKKVQEKVDIDKEFYYDGEDLGLTLTEDGAIFKCWAPLAKSAKVLLYKNAYALNRPAKSIFMKKDSEHPGVWVLQAKVSDFRYYQYEFLNPGKKSKVCDIWAKSASADSVASQIADINSDERAIPENLQFDTSWGTKESYYNPYGSTGRESKSYTEAVIYEMHIRDWSRVEVLDSLGKFTEIADGQTIISHLKDLGVTHVQILPSFEYAEKVSNQMYNWGYNPYNYNVPEGRYVTAGYIDGTQAVREMRYMIGKLHENGIAVIMDVVYNHTSGTGNDSIYDKTVPGYFYRFNDDGSYSNGSGCGNEIATNNKMVRKFVIDSVKHWMLDYHVNGFRFDLMGLHERDTMQAIYDECSKIDPNVMIYGEPWTGGKSKVRFGVSKSTIDLVTEDLNVNGVACFNDDFRDALKGGVFNALESGFLQGDSGRVDKIISGLQGSVRGRGGFTRKIGRSINYIECHDNLTLFDKLAITEINKNYNGNFLDVLAEDQINHIKQEEKMAAAFIFLAQGTPFINGGQEFMRTKLGNANSYMAPDVVNQIDISFKDTYSDVYNTYKALIAFRKDNFFSFGANGTAKAEIIDQNVIKYTAGKYVVYFNSNKSSEPIQETGRIVTINEENGTYSIARRKSTITTVPAQSFVIIQQL